MNGKMNNKRCGIWSIFLFVLVASALFAANVQAVEVFVKNPAGAPVAGFRWLLEEDNTNVTVPGAAVRVSISTDIHNSHAPVVAQGEVVALDSVIITLDASGSALDTSKRYFVTVLPESGYTIGGTLIEADPSHPAAVTVTVNALPLPTAQISLFAFVDHNPINNIFDEHDQGLGGAGVVISDTGGQMSADAFGNPLGTQYNPDGSVLLLGSGTITTLTQEEFDLGGIHNPYNLRVGEALVKYLVPGKYGLVVVPPGFDDNGVAMTWSQTSTIEGTSTVDAWVKANEPKLFVEGFGTGFNHVFYGFLKVSPVTSTFKGQTFETLEWNQTPPVATGTITGTLRMNHFSKPPTLQGFFPGITVPGGWVGLNDPNIVPGGAITAGKYAAATNEDGSFLIENVPPGIYQLVTWDTYLDTLFGFYTVTIPPGPGGTGDAVALGDVLTFRWFGTLQNYVFFDADEDGFRDPGEPGIPEQNVNLRFRDGTIYQAFPTDIDGFVPFDEVFPFFKWLVVEVDYARFKATGMTTAIDDGGLIPGPAWPADGNKNPQPQDPADPFNENATLDYRTETGPVLTQAMHLFLGQTNLIEWGKTSYGPGENGGVSGMVFYAVTRAENDPRYAAAEGWEPGVPRVQMNLYDDMVVNATGVPGSDGIIDDINASGDVTLADVDNYPFNWAPMYEPLVPADPQVWFGVPGPEDIDLNGDTVFNFGDAIQVTTTDSWDDNKPSGCIQDLPDLPGLGPINECADSFGTWNQVRPGLFDGGYAFSSYFSGFDAGSVEIEPLPVGTYIVEAITPPGYDLLKEEDRNVDFGDSYTPSTLLLPATCVGELHVVPDFMSFERVGVTPAPFAGDIRPYCDRKQVTLSTGQNAAADFFVFTQVPKAARAVGFVNNDLGAEFNQASPIFGEKLAAAWLPVSFTDWAGNELVRVYTDEFGGFNAMLPSTYTVNVASPTGVSPSMITLTINTPFLADGVTQDPFYDPDYAVTPWTFNYMPGATSYLDTPIVPITAFTANDTRIDTGPANNTPVIYSVTTASQPGPLVCNNPVVLPQNITITAPPGGTVTIRNPLYPTLSTEPTVVRNVGFGVGQGTGTVTLDGTSLGVATTWTNELIVISLPGGSTTGQIMVTRDNGLSSELGVTLSVVDCTGLTVRPVVADAAVGATPIQDAVDVAVAGDIILVGPGHFNENVIMDKPVRLQGVGAASFINANPVPTDRLDTWHADVDALGAQDFISFLLKNPFSAGEAPGVFVIGETIYPQGNLQNPDAVLTNTLNPGNPFSVPGQAAIDGFTISGSKAGGAIFAVSGAIGLEISNNNITGNQGNFAGGIAIGTPDSGFPADVNDNSINKGVVIRNNKIHRNGGVQGGGGVTLNEGSEGYLVSENIIIGNFGRFNGGGILHQGLSIGDNVIRNNQILFNEVFFGALLAIAGDGAGIFIGGDVAGGTGSGSVTIDSNLIQGNMSGAGDGGGIRAFAVNAEDVRLAPNIDTTWYRLNIFNNMIVNNVAGNSGAGISLQDVARANIVNNTIAHNDSTATSALSFEAGAVDSTPQPSGVVAGVHSTILQSLFGASLVPPEPTYSDPLLVNNIVWENRSFFNDASLNSGAGGLAPNPAGQYWDLHVLGSVSNTDPHLNPEYNILTSLTNPATGFDYTVGGTDTTNSLFAPGLLNAYFNFIESTTVVDEGGNAINLRFTPIALGSSDYHIGTGNAWNNGTDGQLAAFTELALDFDGETRPFDANPSDIGADEIQFAPAAVASWGVVNVGTPITQLTDFGSASNVQVDSIPAAAVNVPAGTTSVPVDTIPEISAPVATVITDVQVDSVPEASIPAATGVTNTQTGLIVRVQETVTEVLASVIPGLGESTHPDDNREGSSTQLPFTRNVPESFDEEDTTVEKTQSLTLGDEEQSVVQNAPLPLPDENSRLQSFPNPEQGEASLSGNGSERILPMANMDQSGTDLTAGGQQSKSNSTIFRSSLIGLMLAGLAFGFFFGLMPWIKKRREQ
jgi:large repetitive protein